MTFLSQDIFIKHVTKVDAQLVKMHFLFEDIIMKKKETNKFKTTTASTIN